MTLDRRHAEPEQAQEQAQHPRQEECRLPAGLDDGGAVGFGDDGRAAQDVARLQAVARIDRGVAGLPVGVHAGDADGGG